MRTGARVVSVLTVAGAPWIAAATSFQRSQVVELVGLSGQRRSVGLADLAKLPHVQATVSSHNVQGTYRGVLLGEVLRLVDRPEGPFRLIVPDEKRPARWAKNVVRIRLVAME